MGIPKPPPAGLATMAVQFSFNFELMVVFVCDFIVRQYLFVYTKTWTAGVLRCHLRLEFGSNSVCMDSLCAAFKAAGGAGT